MATAALFRPGATAVITGGASGVGFAFANLCRTHGMHVCILDNNPSSLSAATSALKSHPSTSTHPGILTTSHQLDVSDLNAWTSLTPQILSSHPKIDILMLNAGTSYKPSTPISYTDPTYFQKTLNTNLYGILNGLTSLLPSVLETSNSNSNSQSKPTQKSAIIITGSKQGITNPPGAQNPAYNMSKSAVKTLAEHLSYDLRTPSTPSYAPSVSVHLLIPGWTYTGLSGNVGPTPSEEVISKKPEGAWLASQIVEYAEPRINKGQFYIVCPDNDVDEALDEARMKWAIGDVSENRPALSRWEDNYKDEAAQWIAREAEKRRQG